tara:strand:- start:116 stop:745 length:630 start_codon:yes stop_codon:yes gene_type:complete
MDDLIGELKKYLSTYSKHIDNYNLEISIGNSLGKYIFDTNVSNKYWKNIKQKIETSHDYSRRKEFSYRIYSDFNKKLYVDSSGKLKCMETDVKNQSLCYNNTKGFDFKISLLEKKAINTATFPPKYKYHNLVDRNTVSYNFNNQFYINMSQVVPVEKGQVLYTITLLILKNNKISKNILLKNIMKQLQDIYSITNDKMIDFKVYDHYDK